MLPKTGKTLLFLFVRSCLVSPVSPNSITSNPWLSDLAAEFNPTASHSSLAVSFSTLGMAAGLCTAMFVADSIPRKKLISAALLSSSVASVICSYSPSFGLLVALSALKGFLLAGATSVSLPYISEEVHPESKKNHGPIYRR